VQVHSEIELKFRVVFFAEGGELEKPAKNPGSKGENQQTTLLTFDAESGFESGTA
jgi:hypothetical protein